MNGPQALQRLIDGLRVRKNRWTPDCWISAEYDSYLDLWTFYGHGTPNFMRDVEEDQGWILVDLMEDGWTVELETEEGEP